MSRTGVFVRSTCLAICFLAPGSAGAAELNIAISNNRPLPIVGFAATPKDETDSVPAASTLPAPIPSGETGTIVVTAAESQCLFHLSFQFEDGSTLERPDVDLCETEGIIVQ